MNIAEILRRNPDIYDALVDVYSIDLTANTVELLSDDIDRNIDIRNAFYEYLDDNDMENTPTFRKVRDEIAQLGMIKQFIKLLDYYAQPIVETIGKSFDDFIRDEANEYYNTHTGINIAAESHDTFQGNEIRTVHDLSDNDQEFNTREYDAFEYAIELWEAIENKQ